MIRIVLADDHRIFREGLKMILADNAAFVLVGSGLTGLWRLRRRNARQSVVNG